MPTNHVIQRDIGWGLFKDPTDDIISISSATDGIRITENGVALDTINVLTSTSITKALSAFMGTRLNNKKLENGGYTGTAQDIVDNKIDKIRIINGADLNLINEAGFYSGISLINTPEAFDQNYLGTMIIIEYDSSNFTQLLIQAHETNPKLFYRTHNTTSSFSPWVQMATIGMIDGFEALKLNKIGDVAEDLKCKKVPVDPTDIVRKEDLDSVSSGSSSGLSAHISNVSGAHHASAISYSPHSWNTATNVQDAIIQTITKVDANSSTRPELIWTGSLKLPEESSGMVDFGVNFEAYKILIVAYSIEDDDIYPWVTYKNTSVIGTTGDQVHSTNFAELRGDDYAFCSHAGGSSLWMASDSGVWTKRVWGIR